MDKKVSVVLPVFNGETYLAQSIDSIPTVRRRLPSRM